MFINFDVFLTLFDLYEEARVYCASSWEDLPPLPSSYYWDEEDEWKKENGEWIPYPLSWRLRHRRCDENLPIVVHRGEKGSPPTAEEVKRVIASHERKCEAIQRAYALYRAMKKVYELHHSSLWWKTTEEWCERWETAARKLRSAYRDLWKILPPDWERDLDWVWGKVLELSQTQ